MERAMLYLLTLGIAVVLATALTPASARAATGNLFEGDTASGTIFEFTPGGTKSTFASGQGAPEGLAFDSAGNLFEAEFNSNSIFKFTPGGTRSTFASGLNGPLGLAFDSAGNLFESDQGSNSIFEFTPGGTESTFASGLNSPQFLAFQHVGDVPEPSTWALLVGGGASLFAFRLFTI